MTDAPNRETFCSYAPVDDADLRRLVDLSLPAFDDRFKRRPEHSGAFAGRMFLLCLCQGAALHRVAPEAGRGIHDFDVWGFFKPVEGKSFPPRSPINLDHGSSMHGHCRLDPAHYVGRRIDLWGRDIVFDGDAVRSLRRYLTTRPTASAWHLAQRPVVGLWPEPLFGEVLWGTDDLFDPTKPR